MKYNIRKNFELKGIGKTDMVIIIHILTILLAVASFFIIKKKRYKVVPLVSWIIFVFLSDVELFR